MSPHSSPPSRRTGTLPLLQGTAQRWQGTIKPQRRLDSKREPLAEEMKTRMDSSETQTIVPVQEIMQRNVRTTAPDRPIVEVAQLLIDENLTGIPVVDGSGVLVG